MAWKNDCERVFGSLARNYVYQHFKYFIQLPRCINSAVNTVNDLICTNYNEEKSKLHFPFKLVKMTDNHFGINVYTIIINMKIVSVQSISR